MASCPLDPQAHTKGKLRCDVRIRPDTRAPPGYLLAP
jgi:hypothetical protein